MMKRYGLNAKTLTNFYLLHAEYDLELAQVSMLQEEYRILKPTSSKRREDRYSAEVGYVLLKMFHVAVGYNFIGNRRH